MALVRQSGEDVARKIKNYIKDMNKMLDGGGEANKKIGEASDDNEIDDDDDDEEENIEEVPSVPQDVNQTVLATREDADSDDEDEI